MFRTGTAAAPSSSKIASAARAMCSRLSARSDLRPTRTILPAGSSELLARCYSPETILDSFSADGWSPMDVDRFEAELSRRLATIEDPEYDDPARADLPRTDLVVLVVGVIVVVVAMWLWG